jgi:hypothetical protein
MVQVTKSDNWPASGTIGWDGYRYLMDGEPTGQDASPPAQSRERKDGLRCTAPGLPPCSCSSASSIACRCCRMVLLSSKVRTFFGQVLNQRAYCVDLLSR